ARAIGDPDLSRPMLDQADDHRTGSSACSQNEDWSRIRAPARLGLVQALHEADAVIVESLQGAVGLDHDGIDGADTLRHWIDFIKQRNHALLVRHGDIAAAKAQNGKPPESAC